MENTSLFINSPINNMINDLLRTRTISEDNYALIRLYKIYKTKIIKKDDKTLYYSYLVPLSVRKLYSKSKYDPAPALTATNIITGIPFIIKTNNDGIGIVTSRRINIGSEVLLGESFNRKWMLINSYYSKDDRPVVDKRKAVKDKNTRKYNIRSYIFTNDVNPDKGLKMEIVPNSECKKVFKIISNNIKLEYSDHDMTVSIREYMSLVNKMKYDIGKILMTRINNNQDDLLKFLKALSKYKIEMIYSPSLSTDDISRSRLNQKFKIKVTEDKIIFKNKTSSDNNLYVSIDDLDKISIYKDGVVISFKTLKSSNGIKKYMDTQIGLHLLEKDKPTIGRDMYLYILNILCSS